MLSQISLVRWWDSPGHDTTGENGFIVNLHRLEKATKPLGFHGLRRWASAIDLCGGKVISGGFILHASYLVGFLESLDGVAPYKFPPDAVRTLDREFQVTVAKNIFW